MHHADSPPAPGEPGSPGPMAGEQPWRLSLDDGGALVGFERPGGRPPDGMFLHGFRSHCDGGKARRLSQAAGDLDCRWLRFDQRGCGMSPGSFRRFTLSGAVNDTVRVLDALADPLADPPAGSRRTPSSCVLAGSSLGALIAIHATLSRPEKVAGLLLIAPALRFTQHFIHEQLDDADLALWRRRGYRWLPDLYAGGCYRLDYAFCEDALRYGEPPAALPVPVRAVHGTRDELLPWRETRNWVEGLDCPARSLEIIEGGDHRLTEWSDVIARQLEYLVEEVRH